MATSETNVPLLRDAGHFVGVVLLLPLLARYRHATAQCGIAYNAVLLTLLALLSTRRCSFCRRNTAHPASFATDVPLLTLLRSPAASPTSCGSPRREHGESAVPQIVEGAREGMAAGASG